ncbi:MAG TPA: hypothetical protein VHV75_12220 [Solirubrobacteraceae bacterium]|jgi:hypothetical protein|nr:hypothetical protein [Solirubrobacteraceae bacterium]
MSAADIAALGAAVFAAVAAGASWASVLQTRRERIEAQKPHMTIDVILPPDTAQVLVQLANHGASARQVEFAVATDGQITHTVTERPTLLPGETREYDSGIQRSTNRDPVAFVSCYDLTGATLYAWWPNGDHRVYRPRERADERPSRADLMSHVLPGFDPTRLALVRPTRLS